MADHDTHDHTGIPGVGASGAVTTSGLTMATARLLGRTTASSGAIEEISVGSGLTLSGGSLSASGGGGTTELLGRTFWNPGSQQNPNTTSTTLVDVDATNLAVTFTAPASGNVLVRVEAAIVANNWGVFGVREGTSILAEGRVQGNSAGSGSAVRSFLITGVSAGSHTYKFGFSAGASGGTMNIYANAQTTSGSVGPASIEVWAA